MADDLLHRFSLERLLVALNDTPAVMINGPRQCGKTTLVRDLVKERRTYLTLDDETTLQSAQNDPVGLISPLEQATIDEIQRVPALLRAIKKSVDEKRQPGRFLLTGSANILVLPKVAESLAGRMEIITLLPLSQSEIRKTHSNFLAEAFARRIPQPTDVPARDELVNIVLQGGYPEMLTRSDSSRRRVWARNYVQAIVTRDVRDIAEIHKVDLMPKLLKALAHCAGQLSNYNALAGELGIDSKTAQRYANILEQLFLITRLEPWHRNKLSRLVKSPKIHFLDSGLLASLLNITAQQIIADRTSFGPLLETFVFSEILKHVSWQDTTYHLSHYRDKEQREVDLVIEDEYNRVVGLEIKAAATVTKRDFSGLEQLQSVAGQDFQMGIVLYDGDALVPFGNNLFAAPIACLWD